MAIDTKKAGKLPLPYIKAEEPEIYIVTYTTKGFDEHHVEILFATTKLSEAIEKLVQWRGRIVEIYEGHQAAIAGFDEHSKKHQKAEVAYRRQMNAEDPQHLFPWFDVLYDKGLEDDVCLKKWGGLVDGAKFICQCEEAGHPHIKQRT